LYIPPEALEVFLDTFEGPLDLLLYLIRRQNLNILDVKVAVITAQYMEYIDLMQALELELAGEYLLMACHVGGNQIAHVAAATRNRGRRR
jgi:segregation and condensation protein A